MPDVMARGRLSLQPAGVVGAKFRSPSQDGFVGDQDVALADLLDEAQAQGETEIEADFVRDDLGRKSVALVADGAKAHNAAPLPDR
jgi:hypothetical protein